ncbi:MAG: (Fe-S)-binding protein [Candidatus Coatesbacteria bacterium]
MYSTIPGAPGSSLSLDPFLVPVAAGIAGAIFLARIGRLLRLMRAVGGRARVAPRAALERIATLVREVLLHERMLRVRGIGVAHWLIFLGFLAVQPHALETFLEPYGFSWHRIWPGPARGYHALAEVFAALVLAGLAYAFLRRWTARLPTLSDHLDARLVLVFTAVLVGSLLLLDAFRALEPGAAERYPLAFRAASALGLDLMPEAARRAGREAVYWLHILSILGFVAYLPGSKHLHIFTSIPNLLVNAGSAGRPFSAPDLDGGEAAGLGTAGDLSWKQVLDVVSCTECGRCEAVCPASLTGKRLSPKRVVVDVRNELRRQTGAILENERAGRSAGEGLPPLAREESGITGEVLFACTTCRACEEACPVGIWHLDLIVDARRHLVLMESRFPPELQQTFTNLENQSNPWGFPPDERGAWARAAGVPTIRERPDAEVLFWVGCAGSFDETARRTTLAVASLLKKAGVSFAILGNEECCTGDPARRAGNEYLGAALAKQAAGVLAASVAATGGAATAHAPRLVVTACPHCLNSIRREFPGFGAQVEALHHSEYLARLVCEGRLRPRPGGPPLGVVIHDSCYLGRWSGAYAPSRAVLGAIPGVTVTEPPRGARNALCCGAGGGRMFMEETGKRRISDERAGELAGTGAAVAAVGCPFCATMLSDGMRATGATTQVKDIAVLLDQATA